MNKRTHKYISRLLKENKNPCHYCQRRNKKFGHCGWLGSCWGYNGFKKIVEESNEDKSKNLKGKIMRSTTYLETVQKAFVEQLDFSEDPEFLGVPVKVPDGEYSLTIDGKIIKVRIKNGKIE